METSYKRKKAIKSIVSSCPELRLFCLLDRKGVNEEKEGIDEWRE